MAMNWIATDVRMIDITGEQPRDSEVQMAHAVTHIQERAKKQRALVRRASKDSLSDAELACSRIRKF